MPSSWLENDEYSTWAANSDAATNSELQENTTSSNNNTQTASQQDGAQPPTAPEPLSDRLYAGSYQPYTRSTSGDDTGEDPRRHPPDDINHEQQANTPQYSSDVSDSPAVPDSADRQTRESDLDSLFGDSADDDGPGAPLSPAGSDFEEPQRQAEKVTPRPPPILAPRATNRGGDLGSLFAPTQAPRTTQARPPPPRVEEETEPEPQYQPTSSTTPPHSPPAPSEPFAPPSNPSSLLGSVFLDQNWDYDPVAGSTPTYYRREDETSGWRDQQRRDPTEETETEKEKRKAREREEEEKAWREATAAEDEEHRPPPGQGGSGYAYSNQSQNQWNSDDEEDVDPAEFEHGGEEYHYGESFPEQGYRDERNYDNEPDYPDEEDDQQYPDEQGHREGGAQYEEGGGRFEHENYAEEDEEEYDPEQTYPQEQSYAPRRSQSQAPPQSHPQSQPEDEDGYLSPTIENYPYLSAPLPRQRPHHRPDPDHEDGGSSPIADTPALIDREMTEHIQQEKEPYIHPGHRRPPWVDDPDPDGRRHANDKAEKAYFNATGVYPGRYYCDKPPPEWYLQDAREDSHLRDLYNPREDPRSDQYKRRRPSWSQAKEDAENKGFSQYGAGSEWDRKRKFEKLSEHDKLVAQSLWMWKERAAGREPWARVKEEEITPITDKQRFKDYVHPLFWRKQQQDHKPGDSLVMHKKQAEECDTCPCSCNGDTEYCKCHPVYCPCTGCDHTEDAAQLRKNAIIMWGEDPYGEEEEEDDDDEDSDEDSDEIFVRSPAFWRGKEKEKPAKNHGSCCGGGGTQKKCACLPGLCSCEGCEEHDTRPPGREASSHEEGPWPKIPKSQRFFNLEQRTSADGQSCGCRAGGDCHCQPGRCTCKGQSAPEPQPWPGRQDQTEEPCPCRAGGVCRCVPERCNCRKAQTGPEPRRHPTEVLPSPTFSRTATWSGRPLNLKLSEMIGNPDQNFTMPLMTPPLHSGGFLHPTIAPSLSRQNSVPPSRPDTPRPSADTGPSTPYAADVLQEYLQPSVEPEIANADQGRTRQSPERNVAPPIQDDVRQSVEPQYPPPNYERDSTPAYEDRSLTPSPFSQLSDVEMRDASGSTIVPPNLSRQQSVPPPSTEDQPPSPQRPVAPPIPGSPIKQPKRGDKRKSGVQGGKVDKRTMTGSKPKPRNTTRKPTQSVTKLVEKAKKEEKKAAEAAEEADADGDGDEQQTPTKPPPKKGGKVAAAVNKIEEASKQKDGTPVRRSGRANKGVRTSLGYGTP